MSKAKYKHTNHLDELLEHLKKGTDGLDAFDKEALEGFSALESKDEAFRLKNEMDEQFESKMISSAANAKNIRLYWAAAAGLLLLLGFITIFKFIGLAEKQELAQNPETKENINAPLQNTPTEIKAAEKQELQQKEKTKTNIIHEQKAIEADDMTSGKSAEKIANRSKEGTSEKGDAQALSPSMKTEAEDVEELVATKAAPAKDAMGVTLSLSESKKQSQLTEKIKEEQKGDKSTPERVKKSKQEALKPSASAETMAIAETNQPRAVVNMGKLTISEKELKEKLDAFLKDKSYKQTFSCVLKVSSANEIKDVTFLNSKQFSRKAEKEITEFLKSLNCFQSSLGTATSFYTINYQMP
jgi:hypothetical protein